MCGYTDIYFQKKVIFKSLSIRVCLTCGLSHVNMTTVQLLQFIQQMQLQIDVTEIFKIQHMKKTVNLLTQVGLSHLILDHI